MTRETARRRSPIVGSLEGAARFVRLFSMGATVTYLLVGVATAGTSPRAGVVAWAVATGVLFHVYADVGNDVIDLPVDRTDPRRALSPLARGQISPQAALAVALVAIPLLLAGLCKTAGAALGPLVVALVLIGLYDLAGKALSVPGVADVVQGCGWASLVVAGATAGGGATATTWWAATAVVVYIVIVNGVHGSVRDVVNDRRAGAHTTAMFLGADVVDGKEMILPSALVRWGAGLHVGFGVTLIGALAAGGVGSTLRWTVSAVAAGATYAVASVALAGAYGARFDLRRAMALGTWHLFLLPASLLVAAVRLMPWWMAAVSVVGFMLPPLAYGSAMSGRDFDMPGSLLTRAAEVGGSTAGDRLRGLWEMTRPGTAAAAAALVVVGAVTGGGVGWRLVPLTVATALAVAAANVFNDRCDEPADVVNRPDRPLIAGRTTGNDADKFVLAASLGAVAASATLGAAASFAAAALLVAGLGYSLLLRRVAFVGQAAVGALFAVPLLYGAAFSRGGVTGRTWIALGLAAMYVFAREVIKGIPDRPGDLAAGYRTPATVLGEAGALRLFRGAAVAFCAASVAAYLVADDPAYLAASLVCGVLPTLRTLAMVRGTPSADALSRAIAFSGLVFAAGVVPLLLLA